MPYQKHDTISKAFFSKGFAVGVPIAQDSYKSNPRRFDIKTLQEKNHFRMHAADTYILLYVQNLGIQSSFPICPACTAELLASLPNSPQHQIQGLVLRGAEKLKYHHSVAQGWVKDDPVTLVACSKGLSYRNVTREIFSGVNRPIAMERNRTILGKKDQAKLACAQSRCRIQDPAVICSVQFAPASHVARGTLALYDQHKAKC